MDTFAYSHLALEYEAASNDESATLSSNSFEGLNARKVSSGWIGLAAMLIFASILGVSEGAMAKHHHHHQHGHRGSKVAALQYKLKKLGYFHANITGYYGPITKHAVMKFQKQHGLLVDGVVGPQTKYAMKHGRRIHKVKHAHRRKHHRVNYVKHASRVCGSCSGDGVLSYGDRGYKVKKLQMRLARLGYFHAKATGYYGPITKHAVKKYQRHSGLKADGMVGRATRRYLKM